MDSKISFRSAARDFIKQMEGKWLNHSLPRRLRSNQTGINSAQLEELSQSLIRNYFCDEPDDFLSSPLGKADMANHLRDRLEKDRYSVVPWLDSLIPLNKARIMEIGCGTGTSSVALAEQGAELVGVDIVPGSLRVAEDRCRLHGVSAKFCEGNACDVDTICEGTDFDCIVYFASLEHMTYAERIQSLKKAWDRLGPNGLLCIVGTPNRLWFYDGHTSFMNYFNWLPDEIAYDYSSFSPRDYFNSQFQPGDHSDMISFLRLGRGVSYHECELAMGPMTSLDVAGCMDSYMLTRSPVRWLAWQLSFNRKYASLLKRISPNTHPAFLQQMLNVALRKH